MVKNNNSGFLHKNKNKLQPMHKDYEGTAQVNGVHYWLSAWIKEPKEEGAERYLSIAFDPVVQKEL